MSEITRTLSASHQLAFPSGNSIQSQAYVCGLVGVIGAMAVEVLLFIIRSEREELLKRHPIVPTSLKPAVSLRPSAPASAAASSNAAPRPTKEGSFKKTQ